MHAVVLADRAFAGVMGKAANLRALVQRQDGIGRQRAKAHRRDVEHAGMVGLGAGRHRLRWRIGRATNPDAEIMAVQPCGCHRVVDPFIAACAHIHQGAERAVVRVSLGTLVDQRALGAREGQRFGVAFDEVLTHFRADEFQEKAHMADDRVVAQDGVARLAAVAQTQQRECGAGQHGQPPPGAALQCQRNDAGQQQQHAQHHDGVADGKNLVELVHRESVQVRPAGLARKSRAAAQAPWWRYTAGPAWRSGRLPLQCCYKTSPIIGRTGGIASTQGFELRGPLLRELR